MANSILKQQIMRWCILVVVQVWHHSVLISSICSIHLRAEEKYTYWYGARSRREIFYEEEFREIEKKFPNFKFNLALSEPLEEDKWDGYVGFIHQVLYDNYLSKHEEPEEIEYYLCGPPMMNDAVLKLLYDMGIPDEAIAFDDFGG